MPLGQVDAGNTAIMNLLVELLQVGSALVPYPSLGEEAAGGSALVDADAEVNILAKAHLGETAQLVVQLAADTHIEGAGVELLVHLFLATAYAAGGEEGCHTIVDGLLHGRETLVGTVGAAESINFS